MNEKKKEKQCIMFHKIFYDALTFLKLDSSLLQRTRNHRYKPKIKKNIHFFLFFPIMTFIFYISPPQIFYDDI